MTRPAHTALTSLDELVARLEAAEDYDPLLNVAIWRVVDPDAVARMERELSRFGVDDSMLANNCEDFVGSLDAAMGLVPEGWDNRTIGIHRDWSEAILGLPGAREAYGKAATPALALCIAALRARVQP